VLRNHGNRPAGEGSGSTQEASSSDEFVTPVSSYGPSPAATPGGLNSQKLSIFSKALYRVIFIWEIYYGTDF
jgi:hypothetical protein